MNVPNGWSKVRLSTLSKNRISNGVFNDPKKVGSGYRLINVVNLYTLRHIDVDKLNLLELTDKEFRNFQVENNDLFFTRSSLKLEGIAHCNIFDGKEDNIVYECHIMRVRPICTKVIPKYLLEYCQSYSARKHFMSCAKTGTMTTIDQEGVGSLNVLLPPLSEQQKIAQILSTWDKAIEKLESLITAKQKRKKALMQQLLTGKKRFAGFEGEFIEYRLEQLCLFKRGKGLSKEKLSSEGKYKCILYGELYTKYGEVITNVLSRTNDTDSIKSVSGDILIPSSTTTSGIDLANATALPEDDVLLGGDINILRPDIRKVCSEFLAYLLTHIKKHQIASRAQGITIIHLYGSDLKPLLVKLPDIKEQQKIVSVLSAADKEIEIHQNQLSAFKQQKKGLMQQLLTGKKRVKLDESEQLAAVGA